MTAKTKDGPSPQAVSGWQKKVDRLDLMRKELIHAEDALEEKLRPIREKFEPDIESKRREVAKLEAECVAFGQEHRDILFAEGSEIRTKVSVITGKATPGAVVVAEGYDTREVIENFRAERSLQKYLKVAYSLDKAAIKKVLAGAGEAIRRPLEEAGVALQSGFSVTFKSKGD